MSTTPYNNPDLYKSIHIGGMLSPGKVTLSGHDRVHDWEQQKAKGTVGEFTLNRGPKNVDGITASFALADLEDVEAWDEFQRMLNAARESGKALLMFHPDTVRNLILDVVVRSIGGMQHNERGGATVVCKFSEYRPSKKKPATKAKAGTPQRQGTTTVNDPNAAAKAELSALLAQAREP